MRLPAGLDQDVTAFTDFLSRLAENTCEEDQTMDKTQAGYRAFATRIVTRGTMGIESAHPRTKHGVEKAVILTVAAVVAFLIAHH